MALDCSSREMSHISASVDMCLRVVGQLLEPQRTLVYLDGVRDVHNMGSIVRTCHFLGLDALFTPASNTARLSAVVSRESAGALEFTHVLALDEPRALLDAARSLGVEVVGTISPDSEARLRHLMASATDSVAAAATSIATTSSSTSECSARVTSDEQSKQKHSNSAESSKHSAHSSVAPPTYELLSLTRTRPPPEWLARPRLLVFGSEHIGVKSELLASCTHLLTVRSPRYPMSHLSSPATDADDSNFRCDSLNVSVAAALVLYFFSIH